MWWLLLIFFGVSALGCIIGFKKFVYFLSIGYGFSVVALGLSYAIYACVKGYFDIITFIQCTLFVVYGARLSGFLLKRELKNANYRKVLKEATNNESKMPVFVAFTIWVVCAALYVIQTSPVFFRLFNGNVWIIGSKPELENILLPAIGIVLSIIGIVLEAIADRQKSAAKQENPNMVATKGLYKMVRCPNYFGEIIFWTGVFVGGLATYKANVSQWILAGLGYVCIVYIMFNGAKRLDRRQEKHYGKMDEYRQYADHTPLIIPLIPISHLGKYKVEDMEAIANKKASKKAKKDGQ